MSLVTNTVVISRTEKVINRDFSDSRGWNLSGLSDWAISDGALVKSGTTAGGGPAQPINLAPGRSYRVQFDIVDLSGGLFATRFIGGGSASAAPFRSAAGTYIETIVAQSPGSPSQAAAIQIIANQAAATGTVDNVSVR